MLVPCWNVTIMTQSMVGLKWCQNQALGHGLNKNKCIFLSHIRGLISGGEMVCV